MRVSMASIGCVCLLGSFTLFAQDLTALQRAANRIDELVAARLDEQGIPPSPRCTDAVFLRRVHLDIAGTLPDLRETRRFLASRDPNRRAQLIDQLLASDAYADYWSMKWCDVLRVKSEFPSKLWPNAVQAYARWLHESLRENKPYDRFAYELLTASGSNFRVPEVNFYRAIAQKSPEKISEAVQLTFMGTRGTDWTDEQRLGMAAFFGKVGYKPTSEWKEEIVYFDRSATTPKSGTAAPQAMIVPDGTQPVIPSDRDPREIFADWLLQPDNPWFARNIVNRYWYWLLGRGIIDEPDDRRADNPPQNELLLRYLESAFVASGYDLKHLLRLILNSETYQRSCIPNKGNATDDRNFSHYYVRQLDAEVLIDAICDLTDTHELYSSQVPEPFTFIPPTSPSTLLADGSISSPFLEMFGRPPHDTGLLSERNNSPSATQRLHMLNSTHIQKKIRTSPKLRLLARRARGNDLTKALYLAVLSRYPTDHERAVAQDYMAKSGLSRQEAGTDLVWALINTKEFYCRH